MLITVMLTNVTRWSTCLAAINRCQPLRKQLWQWLSAVLQCVGNNFTFTNPEPYMYMFFLAVGNIIICVVTSSHTPPSSYSPGDTLV